MNGRIHTMANDPLYAEAIAVYGDKIIAVGQNKDTLGLPGHWERIDLGGRTVLPGLIDCHIHFLQFALGLSRLNVDRVPSLAETVYMVKERVDVTEPGHWIIGKGWNYNIWREQRFPRKEDLDPISPKHPVLLSSKDGHVVWVNSRAMELAQMDRNTPDPDGGKIERNASGKPTGILKERAAGLVWRAVPVPPKEMRQKALREAMKVANRMGLTGVHVGEGREAFEDFQELQTQGDLSLRVLMMPPGGMLNQLTEIGVHSGFGNEWIRIGPIKLFVDGALGGQTAALFEGYEGRPDNTGILTMTQEALTETVMRASDGALSIAIHAIGDRANHIALDAIAAAQEVIRQKRLRPRIEHAQLLRPDDFKRMAELGVMASMQPIHATSDSVMADRHWGARSAYSYAWRRMLDSGVRLAFGSDCPVETLDPLKGLYAAVTRKQEDGTPERGWYPDQCLSIKEAIRAYTLDAAYASGEERIKGSIEVGKWADFVVLSEDIFSEPPEKLLETEVVMTVVGGAKVYERS